MSSTKTTVVIFSFNQEKYIIDCLQSIYAQRKNINQIIISDDASTDSTKYLISKFIDENKFESYVFLNRDVNIGFVKSFNNALDYATGDLIFIQAGDDVSAPLRIDNTLEAFDSLKPSIIYTSYNVTDETGKVLKTVKRSGYYNSPDKFIRKGSGIPPFGMAFDRNLVDASKIRSDLNNEDDFMSMLGVLINGALVLEYVGYYYRTNPNSISGWSLHQSSVPLLVEIYLNDQKNRTKNLEAWLDIVSRYGTKDSICKLQKKIEVSKFIESIDKKGLFLRFKTILLNLPYISIVDLLLLMFGPMGIVLIQKIRRFKLNMPL